MSDSRHHSERSSSPASTTGANDREHFGTFELATVLSNFDIGTIENIKEFQRGSRKSPKLIITTSTGKYLLKRRATGKDAPARVAFCHQLQMHLATKHFPLPHLIGTKEDNNSMLCCHGTTYELFEYIQGKSYDNSLDATEDAGKILGLFHKLLAGFESDYEPAKGSYHDSPSVTAAMETLPRTLAKTDPDNAKRSNEIRQVGQSLRCRYAEASAHVLEAGFSNWPRQIVHSDWHPGNMLFAGSQILAVIDYDMARIEQRVVDVANGALQFSIVAAGNDPSRWPSHMDMQRFQRFVSGYESDPACMLSRAEIKTVPDLMTEALIAECVIPIAATGSFARMQGLDFLKMVEGKVRWLADHRDEFIQVLEISAEML